MLWNLLGLQRKLDALFDEGWIRLGIGSGDASHLDTVRDGVEDLQESGAPGLQLRTQGLDL